MKFRKKPVVIEAVQFTGDNAPEIAKAPDHRERSFYAPPAGSAGLVPAHSQKTVAFPNCAKRCAFVEAMGVGECESACPWKFDHHGDPVDGDRSRQNVAGERPLPTERKP